MKSGEKLTPEQVTLRKVLEVCEGAHGPFAAKVRKLVRDGVPSLEDRVAVTLHLPFDESVKAGLRDRLQKALAEKRVSQVLTNVLGHPARLSLSDDSEIEAWWNALEDASPPRYEDDE